MNIKKKEKKVKQKYELKNKLIIFTYYLKLFLTLNNLLCYFTKNT